MLLTQAEAIRRMESATGLSEATCIALVKGIKRKYKDGKRDKVWSEDVQDEIEKVLKRPRLVVSNPGVSTRGPQRRTGNRIRAVGLPLKRTA